VSSDGKVVIESETNSEISVRAWLESAGISLLSQWDVLAFIYRHGPCLTSAEQVARLIGYETTAVTAALDWLERENVIQRAGFCQVQLHTIVAFPDDDRGRSLRQLVSRSGSRAERLRLRKLLKHHRIESAQKEQSATFDN
jgi:hypothetical protein